MHHNFYWIKIKDIFSIFYESDFDIKFVFLKITLILYKYKQNKKLSVKSNFKQLKLYNIHKISNIGGLSK